MGDGITPLYIFIELFPLILSLFCTPFSMTTFIIGVININSCPVQPLIPVWILVTSIILLIPTVTGCLCIIPCSARYVVRADEKENERLIVRILLLTGLLLAIWSVLGTIWSFHIHRQYQSNNKTLSTVVDCRQWLFKFVLIFSLIINVVTVLILILFLIRVILIIKRDVFPKYTIINV